MANQSAKKNEQQIKSKVTFMKFIMYPLFALSLVLNMFWAIGQSITFWHLFFSVLVSALSIFCIKQTIKCWQLGLPVQASQYYIDILVMNTIVVIFDPFTHKIWHIYWLVALFAVVKIGGYLWEYITPKYEETGDADGEDGKGKKKDKKDKKDKIKYVKA